MRRVEPTSRTSGAVTATPDTLASFQPKKESMRGGMRRASAPTVFLMRSMAMRATANVVKIHPTLVVGSKRPRGLMATSSTITPTTSDARTEMRKAPQIGTPARATAKAM